MPIRSDHEIILEEYPEKVALAEKQYLQAKMQRDELESKLRMEFRSTYPEFSEKAIQDLVVLEKERHDVLMMELAFKETWTAMLETLRVHKSDARNQYGH